MQADKNNLARALAVGGCIVALLLLMLPALWNGYPLLQYDTGGYLARWYEGYLVPSRSTVFGIYLHLGEGFHFWPVVIAQSVLTLWIGSLVLRTHGVARNWRTCGLLIIALCVTTTLPWLTSILLTDIFAGLGVLALHLLLFRAGELRRGEQFGLALVVAFAAASHSGTFAMLLAVFVAGAAARLLLRVAMPARALAQGGGALMLGALMLLTANFALSGRWMWTPGGYGIAFGRLLQDGIVARYLKAHCPEPRLRLCPYQNELPATADEFLWSYGVFNQLGRFDGLGAEMRTIVVYSLAEYPGQHIRTALAATAEQLLLVATGAGVHDRIWHTYGIIEHFIPGEVPAMRAARQQHGELDFVGLNRLHVPVALLSMVLVFAAMLRFGRGRGDALALLAASVSIATLANAFVCGALSGPHERYGARMSWVMTFVVIVIALRMIAEAKTSRAARHTAVTSAP